jgi:septal ring-binding cell division protein DamX
LRLVLIGQPSLEARLHEPVLQSLGPDIRARVTLEPLDRDEILRYVGHRSEIGGDDPGLAALTETSLNEVYEQSEGIPARVNFFVARAMQTETAPAEALTGQGTTDEPAPPTVPTPAAPASLRLAVLAGALVVVAAGGWWWTQRSAAPEPRTPPAADVKSDEASGPPVPSATTPSQSAAASASDPAGMTTVAPAAEAAPPALPVTRAEERAAVPPTLPPDAAPAAVTAPRGAAGPASAAYRITVASFRTASRAAAVASQLQQRNMAVTTRVDASGAWHQVIAGPFATIEAARDAQKSLSDTGFPETQITLPPAQRPVEDPNRR